MENPGNQSEEATGAVEDPPPPTSSLQEQSTSESSSQPQRQQQQQQDHRPPPPLSPLTGSYLLIVVGEPHSERHKEIILQKIAKAFLSWDVNECHVSLEKELQVITSQSPEGEEARYGERLIQYATENLVTEILIHPQLNTLHQCLKNLLSSFTKHRHIIHAGYTFAGNGSWILQDGTLSISDLVEALHEPDVLRVLKAYENSVSIDVHCAPEGDWTSERFQKEPVSKLCNVRINPGDVMTAGNPAISAFIDYLSPFLEPANIQQLLQPTDVVGNIRFTHPTLYVFPGGQGDAALFGINGFNMLIDGGFARKACFWDFARHLDRLDAVLLTRLNNSTVNGISAVLQRKKMNHVYPQIGHFFCNLQDRKIALSPDGDKDKDSLIVNLAEEGQEIVANLRHLALKPHPCYRDGNQVDPVNLYHKVGHGKLDMYVISPARDSQAVKEFLAKWSSNDSHLFSNTGKKVPGKSFEFPLQNLVSICALLVWQPANPNDTITRILFPGSTPQHKIFEGLEKLRHLEFLKHPVCSAKSISPSVSTTTVTRSLSKTRQPKPADNKQKESKIMSKPKLMKPKTEKTPPKEIKSKLDNKLADEKNELEVEEPLKKLDNRVLSKDEQIENIKKEIQKIEQAENEEQKKKIIHRSKYDMRNVKSKVDSRAPSKSIDRKKVPEKKPEGETSPPGTPKKGLTNGTATKTERTRVGVKPIKAASPTSTPAKSAKEANNRKVVEARVTTTRSSSKSVTRKKEETPPPPPSGVTVAKVERKPISRRPKAPLSPVKTSTGKPKPEPDSVPKKVKKKPEVETAVIKAVSQTISKELEKGAETEKTEIGEGQIEIKKLEEDTTENKETDIKAVKIELESAQIKQTNKEDEEDEEEDEEVEDEEEEEEYLIITKEEYGEESAKEDDSGKENEEEMQTEGEGEMKKLLREEEESEKKREVVEKTELQDEEKDKKEGEVKEETDKPIKTEDKIPDEKVVEEDKGKIPDDRRPESPGEKTPEGRESELQRLMEVDEGIDLKEPVSREHKEGESIPEEKMSNTLETSATTAPTLPEDERIEPAEEDKDQPEDIKEVIEEKYIQEKTKEEKQEEAVVDFEQPNVPTTIDVEGSSLPIQTTQRKHPRDVVKTPDEVAELPMHEEVDPRMYSSGEFTKDLRRKSEQEKLDFKTTTKGEANILDEDASGSEDSKKAPVEDPVVTKFLNIIDELEKSAGETKKEEPVQEDQKEDGKIVETKRESLQIGEANLVGQTSGRSTPMEMGKVPSGKSTPLNLEKELSGKSTPQEVEPTRIPTPVEVRDTSGKSSPQEVIREPSGKTTPHEVLKEPSGKSTPLEFGKELSGKSTPQEIEREPSRTSTPLGIEKDASGKTSPQEFVREPFGKTTPHELLKEPSGKSTPLEFGRELSGKSTPQEIEREPSRTSTPAEIVRDVSGKSSPQEFVKETSRTSTPLDVEKELPGKSTPQEMGGVPSRTSTPAGTERDASGKTTPQELIREPSGKTTPHELLKEPSDVSATPLDLGKELSGKSTPQEVDKEPSRISTPGGYAREASGKSTPQDLYREIETGKSTPQDVIRDASGRSTPLDVGKLASGKSTPFDLGKELSGKSTPQEFEREPSRTSTPAEVLRDTSGKTSPQEFVRETSGKSTPHDLIKETSRTATPLDVEKEPSRISTPAGWVKEDSGRSSPQELPGETTPQDLVRETSGRSTPRDVLKETSLESGKEPAEKTTLPVIEKDSSRTSTPAEWVRDESGRSSPHDVKETSGKSTPYELEKPKDLSGKSTPLERGITPQDLQKDTSGKTTPQDLREKLSVESIPLEVARSGVSTPTAEKETSREPTPDKIAPQEGEPTPKGFGEEIPPKQTVLEKTTSSPVDLGRKSSTEPPLKIDEGQISGKSTPVELQKGTPEQPAPVGIDTSTPQDLVKDSEPTSHDLEKEVSREPTPQTKDEKETLEKTKPQELSIETSRISTPVDVAKETTSGKSTPVELDKETRDVDKPVKENLNLQDKTTPQEVEKEIQDDVNKEPQKTTMISEKPISGKTTPEEKIQTIQSQPEKIASGKSTPLDNSRRPSQTLSGKATPCEEERHASSKSSRRESLIESNKISPVPSEQLKTSQEDTKKQEDTNGEEKKDEEKEESPQEATKPSSGKTTPAESLEKSSAKKKAPIESSVSDSVSSGPGEKDVSGKSTPFSTDKEISGKISPPVGGKVTSDSFSLALAEKGTSGTYSLEKESSEKISSPSPVDISPLSLDELKEDNKEKEEKEKEVHEQDLPKTQTQEPHTPAKSQLERLKYEEGGSSGTSTPDRSHYEKSDISLPNGVESEDEPEKGILESERQEKESQILDISSGEEEELKALGDDEDSEPEMRKPDVEGEIKVEIAKGEKDDINKLVKSGGGVETEEEDPENKAGVKRMLVTASSEDGGTETEICIKSGDAVPKEEISDEEDVEKGEETVEGEFSNLILQARKEYIAQRSRKTSYNSSEEVEEAEEEDAEDEDEGEEELGSLLKQARKELAFVRSKNRETNVTEFVPSERKYETIKTTTRSETTRMDDDNIVTITTILTEEREDQEDGSVKVTTTKETTTKGGKNEGTVKTVNTNIEKKTDDEESSSQVNSSGEKRMGIKVSKEEGDGKTSQEDETSRRTSASSIISQEDLVSRKDSAKIEDFRQSSTEMSPLKTTYITSHGDSESLMTSSFYGNLPTEDEMIGRAEHVREFRKGRGYESFTEVGPNGERTERTYFYGGEDDPRGMRDRSRFVKAYYTEEGQQPKEGETRFVHRYYTSDIPEEGTVERSRFVQRFYTEESSQPESEAKYRFVETLQEEPVEHMDFAKAIDEHISARGEYLGKEFQEDIAKYTNGKREGAEGEASGSEKKPEDTQGKKDVIEGWGKPLGLPLPPKNTNKIFGFPGQNISTTSTLSTPTDNSDSVSNWGHPMNLPSPAPPSAVNGTVETLPGKTASKETPKKEKKVPPKKNVSGDNKSSGTNTPNRRSESPVKLISGERRTPSTGRTNRSAPNSYVYLDLTYVPHHGNSYYSNVEFFKKVRARYYVFSGTEPSKEVYNALLEAKQTWEDKKLEVTIIPTYDTDVLGYWVAENEETLAKHKIDLSPSASRCTINLQDHETSCSAYRLEF